MHREVLALGQKSWFFPLLQFYHYRSEYIWRKSDRLTSDALTGRHHHDHTSRIAASAPAGAIKNTKMKQMNDGEAGLQRFRTASRLWRGDGDEDGGGNGMVCGRIRCDAFTWLRPPDAKGGIIVLFFWKKQRNGRSRDETIGDHGDWGTNITRM